MKALIIVDLQKDFMPGGPLGVPGADKLATLINPLMKKFPLVIATQDWHPLDHCSFAKNHPGKKVGESVKIKGISQVLWPVHCVRDTAGAELVEGLDKTPIASHFYKGTDQSIDSYSAFFDNAHLRSTGLSDYLKSRGVTDVYLAGVATDYCVLYSAIDAVDLGFKVYIIEDACRGINLQPGNIDKALAAIAARGGEIITSQKL
ncbi:MAG: bifunctional nicotinamidase/pyrazinamidase [Verrucomicrobia bacterium]|nr:bifunctional nicotinamidase/pyrazinamidase [Verrucomicrobiota bacterium]